MNQRRHQLSPGAWVGIGCGGCLTAFFGLAVLGALIDLADGPEGSSKVDTAVSSSPSPSASATSEEPKAKPDKDGKVVLKDYVKQNLQRSISGVEQAGFLYDPIITDAAVTTFRDPEKSPEDWKICTQDPKPGRYEPTQLVTWEAVKSGEKCPSPADENDSDEDDRDRDHTSGGDGSSGSSGELTDGGTGEDDNFTSGGSGDGDGFTNGGHRGGRWF